MFSQLSAQLFARLVVHWPPLGGNDQAARIRADDWRRVIDRSSPEVAGETCTQLVEGWGSSYPPKIADWQENARRIALQRAIPGPPELEEQTADPRAIALLAEAKAKLTLQRARATPPLKADPKPQRGPVDPHGHMPSYAELYEAEKEPVE